MSVSGFVRFWLTLQGTSVYTQQRGSTVQTDKVQAVNSGHTPYRVIQAWARLDPDGHEGDGDESSGEELTINGETRLDLQLVRR